MKIITLNTWGGRIYEPLLNFLKNNQDVDIFCLQEIFHDLDKEVKTSDYIIEEDARHQLFKEISKIIPEHTGYFCPVIDRAYGIAIFAKNNIKVIRSGDEYIYKNENYNPDSETSDHNRKLQWIEIKSNEKKYLIINVHGHWTAQFKGDNKERLDQSNKILNIANNFKDHHKIICGDFNLRPDTQSIEMFEKEFENLIIKYKINSTRTELYKKQELFADYVFISKDLEEKDFKVMSDVVSDHTPLYLEI